MKKKTFPELIDEIESVLKSMEQTNRRKYQYDEEFVLTMTTEQRNVILDNLREIEREHYKGD